MGYLALGDRPCLSVAAGCSPYGGSLRRDAFFRMNNHRVVDCFHDESALLKFLERLYDQICNCQGSDVIARQITVI
jgi:hypothetical protein